MPKVYSIYTYTCIYLLADKNIYIHTYMLLYIYGICCSKECNFTTFRSAPSAYETSMFSLHSNGQDSGVDFRSSRELYETSPDSFKTSSQHSQKLNASELLCPRHGKHKHSNNNNISASGVSGNGTAAIGNDSR